MSTFEDTVKAHHSQKGTMEMTSPDARDDMNAAIEQVEQWILTHVVPALAERGALPPDAAAAIEAAAGPDTPPERRKLVADQLRDESWALAPVDREIIWVLAEVLAPRSRWLIDIPTILPDRLIDELGLRQTVLLARADETVLAALVRHPRIAAMDKALDAIARVQAELDGRGWTPEAQRLMWAAAKAADEADLSVTIDTHPDGLRILILDAPEVLLDVPYRPGIDQGGYRVRPLDLRPVIAELLALDASLSHDKDAVWPRGASERREQLLVRAWYMARAEGWSVGIDHDPTDVKRPTVAVITLPNGVQLRGHVSSGRIPEDADRIPWDGRPRDLVGIATWLVQGHAS